VVDASGTALGVVEEVSHLPSQDLLVIRAPDDREILIPFVSAFVPTIDIASRRIIVTPPDGLLDAVEDEES